MFDYVKNTYNPNPKFVRKEDMLEDHFYAPYTSAPFLKLQSNVNDLKKVRSKKSLYNIKRSVRLYEEAHSSLQLKICTSREDINEVANSIYFLFNERWKNEYTSASWQYQSSFDKYINAIVDLSDQNQGFIAILINAENNVLAYGYCLSADGTVHLYQHTTTVENSLRKYSLGKIFVYKMINYMISEGYKELDFMCGVNDYKSEWTKEYRQIYQDMGHKSFINFARSKIYIVIRYLQFQPVARKILKSMMKIIVRK